MEKGSSSAIRVKTMIIYLAQLLIIGVGLALCIYFLGARDQATWAENIGYYIGIFATLIVGTGWAIVLAAKTKDTLVLCISGLLIAGYIFGPIFILFGIW